MTCTKAVAAIAIVLAAGCVGTRETHPVDAAVTTDLPDGTSATTKRVFVTTKSYPADLKTAGGAVSGVAGGDSLCTRDALAAQLGGNWKAWLSNDTVSAIDRITDVGPWSS